MAKDDRQAFPECSCPKCVEACRHNPGWMTPAEAKLAIAAGYADRLMRDWLEPSDEVGNDERLYVLAPASFFCEGDDAPELDWLELTLGVGKGQCTFLDGERCSLHESGFKPRQCREALCCTDPPSGPDNYEMARLWQGAEGSAVLSEWARLNQHPTPADAGRDG